MKRFIEGEHRNQVTLLPECLDDYIGEDNPVRAIDAFVEELDLKQLGFAGADPATTGRPAYHPAVLLKIYIYGYLNRIASSRRLEREAQRNVELMWLTGRLAPDFKTIADFRHDNSKGIGNVCCRFVRLCRDLKLFTQAIVAIDSSKFKAVNSRDRNFTPGKVDRRQEQIEESIQRYLKALETADRTQPAEVEAKTQRLREKIATLREQMQRMDSVREELEQHPEQQISLTDPDARSMISQAKGTGMVGYNVQAVVDAKHHLIVAHEVTNIGNDRAQLSKMGTAAKSAMGKQRLQALADRGYFSGPEIKACTEAKIMPMVPKPMTSKAKGTGMVGYNVQAVVDAKHHLIVAHEVTNIGNDRAQLSKMGTAAKSAMGKQRLQALADRGYFSGPEIKACTEAKIMPMVPKPMTSNAGAEGRFSKADFVYLAKDDQYQCPAGERAIHRFSTVEHDMAIHKYWPSACPRCPLKAQCTTSSYRRVTRWEHEAVLEAMQRRLDRKPEAMTLRRRTIEHVFGTLKHWMGSTYFLTRRLEHVGTEMSLQVLAYNFKRLIAILGMEKMMKALRLVSA